jgi:SAM-dependent methyltransferase
MPSLKNQQPDIKCPFCAAEQTNFCYSTADIQEKSWDLYYCSHCRFYFLQPFPTQEDLASAYDTSYYGEGKEKFGFPLIEHTLDYFRSGRARMLKKSLHKNVQAEVLDIGCGNGKFLNYLHQLGFEHLHGIELAGNSAKRAAQYPFIKLHIGDVDTVDFSSNRVDAITLFHVFEHVTNPLTALNKIDSWLKPEGFLMISFPNINSRQARLFKGNWLHLDPPRHLNFIKPNDFIDLLSTKNYTLVKTAYFSAEQNPYGYVQSMLNTFSKKREILFESFKKNKPYLKDVSMITLWLHRIFFVFFMPIFILIDVIDSGFKKSGTVTFVFKKNN